MNIKEYQELALTTAIYPNIGKNWFYPILGLVGEAGELSNILKKSIRDDDNIITQEKYNKIVDELGDLMWYFVILCFELRINPDLVLANNIFKLQERKKNNTIHDKGR